MRTLPVALSCALVMLALGLAGCDVLESDPEPQPSVVRDLTPAEAEVVATDNRFGLKLLGGLQQETPNENVFISPLSVSMALGMTLNGAAGTTHDAMVATLEKAGLSQEAINESYRSLIDLLSGLDPNVLFNIANSIWYREGLEVQPAFLDVNRTYFDAEVEALDFSDPGAPARINTWVDDQTEGKIEKIIDRIDPTVVMYLINAIYFKGSWTLAFDPDDTRDDTFINADGSTSSIRMMNLENASAPVHYGDGFSAIDLGYGNDSLYSMTILLPGDGDVNALVDRLDEAFWNELTSGFRTTQTLHIQLPRFKLEYETSLEQALDALGMGIAFSDQADFTGIRASGGLFIDDVIHKTFVEVNEEGTEAAAVTVVIVAESAALDPVFRVDRPFVFAIRERHSGSILFMGKVMEL